MRVLGARCREVEESIKKAKALHERWQALYKNPRADKEELQWTTKELRTTLKGIEWDLDDLGETISIVEKDPGRFKVLGMSLYTGGVL